jgi:hypothetical protein
MTIRERECQLIQLEQRTLDRARQGSLAGEQLRHLADLRAVAAFRLRPVPADPVEHVRAGYAFIRPRLERLEAHDPADAVSISSEDGYVYTFRPRTMLRRVLDHALDHLNQLEQWVQWQATGSAPEPTDGWASSADRLDEDSVPLSRVDLAAWLWRIDIAWQMLAERAERLSPDQLDWTPPGDDWNLARVLHHVSESFYVVWLDDPLPEDPVARYADASRRLRDAMSEIETSAGTPNVIWLAAEARIASPEQIVSQLIDTEQTLNAMRLLAQ